MTATDQSHAILNRLGVSQSAFDHLGLPTRSPIDGSTGACVRTADAVAIETALVSVTRAFEAWRRVPAPRRGELVRLLGEELRAAKDDLAMLVTLEAGKVTSEGLGEVQEMIDICDFAVGLSRQLYGLTMPSERPGHHMTRDLAAAGAGRWSSPRSIFPSPSGPGMRRWRWCAATR